MKSLQEKQVESELKAISTNCTTIRYTIQKTGGDEYYIHITIPVSLLMSSPFEFRSDIKFLLHLVHNYPFNPPKLFCLTTFSFPKIADGRDILQDIIGEQWKNQFKVYEIINKIPNYLLDFVQNDSLKKQKTLIGKYYLDDKYDYDILVGLPVYFKKVKEHVNIGSNKVSEEGRYLLISDIFFCLFEYEFLYPSNLKLIFWSNIKALVSMKEYTKNGVCEFVFSIKNRRKYNMRIVVDDSKQVINLLMDNLKHFGIDYSISSKEENNEQENK
jgi:ubiquitin-protein ligase